MYQTLSLLICHIIAQLDHLAVVLIYVSVHVELTLRRARLLEVRLTAIPAFPCRLLHVLLSPLSRGHP